MPTYSPHGDTDERPNVRDSRYVPPGDEPVVLPLERRGTLYAVAALVLVALIAMMAGVMVPGGRGARDTGSAER